MTTGPPGRELLALILVGIVYIDLARSQVNAVVWVL